MTEPAGAHTAPTGMTSNFIYGGPVAEHESSLAVLVDFENMARPGIKGRGDFDIHLVLNRLSDKGRVLVKRAYADWSRYRDARHELQNAGLELIEMPSAREGAKNRADIKMAVDAMELAFSREHLDTFVIVSGDSDFTPLVGKLRELNKRVTGMGNRDSTSELLIANCDEFIFYDSLAAAAKRTVGASFDPTEMLRQTLTALQREGTEWPLASVVKDSMRRKNPAFDEADIGYSTFSKFLEAQGEQGIIRLQSDPRSGTYRVELGNSAAAAPLPSIGEPAGDGEAPTARRRRRRRRGESADAPAPATESADVFEFVVDTTAQVDATELPPLDQPISYEDMILLGPELGDDVPELVEASDRPATGGDGVEAEGTPTKRRRRRRSASADKADDAAAAATPSTPAEAPSAETPAAEAPAEAAPAEAAPAEADASRRRRRRTAPAEPTPVDVADVVVAAPEQVIEVVVTADGAVAAADEATAAASSRRVPRGQRGAALLGGDAPVAEEAKPAPKRRTRKAAPKPEAVVEAEPVAVVPAEEATPAPKRRTRKAAPKPEAVVEAEPVAVVPAEEATPAPKRRTRKAAPKPEAVVEAEPVAVVPAEEAKPAPKRRTRKAAPKDADA